MKHYLGLAIGILGLSYIFFPGEMWYLALTIALTLLLIWVVEQQ